MSMGSHPGAGSQRLAISSQKRSLRLRASAEAFDVLRANGSPKISNAELLKHAVRSDHEPHPRIVREVHQALKEAQAARPDAKPSVLQKISGVFSRRLENHAPPIDAVVRRFEQAFLQPD